MSAARVPKEYLRPYCRKKNEVKKCVACDKMLKGNNKTGLCSGHWSIERTMNQNAQRVYKKYSHNTRRSSK